MLIIKKDLGNLQQFKLVVLADLHLGDPLCDLKLIKSTINYIKDTPDCYVIVNGDIMNNAIPGSKSDSIAEALTMAEQQDLAVELLWPIKDRIIAMSPGNHENRSYRLVGIDPLKYVARILGVQNVYATESYIIDLKTRYKGMDKSAKHYTIFGQHGLYGGSRNIGSATNAVQDLARVIANADLYVRSHTHNPSVTTNVITTISDRGGKLFDKTRTFFNSNAFLKYGGYAEAKGYPQTDPSPWVITVDILKSEENGTYFKTYVTKI